MTWSAAGIAVVAALVALSRLQNRGPDALSGIIVLLPLLILLGLLPLGESWRPPVW